MKKTAAFFAIGPLLLSLFSAFSQGVSLPVVPLKVTSPYGWRIHPITGDSTFHQGVDLKASASSIRAVLAGRVSACGQDRFLGKFVRISHGKIESTYGHLSIVLAQVGMEVVAGQAIGISGQSGRATGEHLHFSLRYQGTGIHPLKFLLSLQAILVKTDRP
jgi:murein DD-endopeptidase MepM/ murein hydrolase activator NlpD